MCFSGKKSVTNRLAALLVCSAPLFAGQATATAPSVSQKEADAVVQKFEADYTDAYNHGDAKKLAVLLTDNVSILGEYGAVLQGREKVQRALTASFASIPKWKTEDTPKKTVALSSDVIVTQGITRRTPADASQEPQSILYTKVLLRQGDAWRLAAAQYAREPVMPKEPRGEQPPKSSK